MSEDMRWQDEDGASYDTSSFTGNVYFKQLGTTVIEGTLLTFPTDPNGCNFRISLTSEQTSELSTGDYETVIVINDSCDMPEDGSIILRILEAH